MEEMIVSKDKLIAKKKLLGQELRVITYYKLMKKAA